jgi:hypothetical protein
LLPALDCLQSSDILGRPIPFLCSEDQNYLYLPSGVLGIVTSYRFACCGQIASWKTYVQPDGNEHLNGHYTIDLQVWRPSSTAKADGCYSFVGYDRYSGVLGHRGLVSKISKPSQRIAFHTGDVIGLFIFRHYNSSAPSPKKGGIKLDASYSDDVVWYHVSTQLDPLLVGKESCPLPVGPGKVLKKSIKAAPLLSVQTGKNCYSES